MDVSMNMETFTSHSSMSFHMDRGRLVCNECNGYFPNLVLFENHSHQDETDVTKTIPPVRSGPKTSHVTFSSYSDEDMLKAFHNMSELAGCWVQNGRYFCGQCGKDFINPYLLFSHKILHPQDRVLAKFATPGEMMHTNMMAPNKKRKHVPSKFSGDEEFCEVYPFRRDAIRYAVTVENVAKLGNRTVLHVTEDEHVEAESTAELASEPQPGTSMVIRECYESDDSNNGDNSAVKDDVNMIVVPPVVRSKNNSTTWRTFVTKYDQPLDGYYMSMKNEHPTAESSVSVDNTVRRFTTNPGCEKGFVFTDMDSEIMIKVFRKLPGLRNCTINPDGKFACDMCTYTYDNPYMLFTHRLGHMLTKPPKTSAESNLVFYNMPGLKKCRLEEGKYHCDGCQEKFDNPYLLFTHRLKHDDVDNDDDDDPGASADVQSDDVLGVGDMFNSSGLQKCKLYRGKYYCDKCNESYPDPYLLLNHKVLHSKGRAATGKGTAPKPGVVVINNTAVGATKMKEISVSVLDIESNCTSTATDNGGHECNVCQLQFDMMDELVVHVKCHIKQENISRDSVGEVTPQAETNHISQGETTPSSAQVAQTEDPNLSTQRPPNIDPKSEDIPISQGQTPSSSLVQGVPAELPSLQAKIIHQRLANLARRVYHGQPNTDPIKEEPRSYQSETFHISQEAPTSSTQLDANISTTEDYPRHSDIDTTREITPSCQGETTPSSQVPSHRIIKRIKVKVAIFPVTSDLNTTHNRVHYEPSIPLKRAVIKLERLDVEPSDIVIIPS